MKILDLGVLTGDILLFGGVYSNLHALEALIEQAKQAGIPAKNAICTGDIVAYCADAAGSVARIQKWGCPVLKGNCEAQLAEGADDCGCGYDQGSQCSLLSRAWYAHARDTVAEEGKIWMSRLPDRIVFEHQGLRYGVVHGAASDISKFIWPSTDKDVFKYEIDLLQSELGQLDRVVSGHSGIGFVQPIDNKIWINAGAIGMPAHDGSSETSFTVIGSKYFKNMSLKYNANAQHKKMTAAGLVQGYDRALLSGYWPSEDTLPDDMKLGKVA